MTALLGRPRRHIRQRRAALRALTGPVLLHAVADLVRSGEPLHEVLIDAAGGCHNNRYTNLVADVAAALHLDEPITRWDVDLSLDMPANYGQRIEQWDGEMRTLTTADAVAACIDALAHQLGQQLSAVCAPGLPELVVRVPIRDNAGVVADVRTVRVAAICPQCGSQRGPELHEAIDNGHRYDFWATSCGHLDQYEYVLAEGQQLAAVVAGAPVTGGEAR